jgi:membrane associated rhomboid family serine protease
VGVADRGYMRRPGGPSPIAFGTSWTLRLIVLLAVAYVAVRGGHGWFHRDLAPLLTLSADQIRAGRVWTLLTAALVNASVWDVAFGALALWVFGKLVEETLGGARFVVFVLLAVLVSDATFLAVEFATGGHATLYGVSSLVLAAIVFAAFRYPNLPIVLVVLPLRLWMLAVIYVAIVANDALQGPFDGTAWAPLAGAAFGYAAHAFGILDGFRLPRLRAKPAPHHEPGPYGQGNARNEIDRILDKINTQGIGSLTDDERDFLKRNSGQYR